MAEYQVHMTDDGDASIINLNTLDEIVVARSEIRFVARDLLAIMGFTTYDWEQLKAIASDEAQAREAHAWVSGTQFVQCGA